MQAEKKVKEQNGHGTEKKEKVLSLLLADDNDQAPDDTYEQQWRNYAHLRNQEFQNVINGPLFAAFQMIKENVIEIVPAIPLIPQ